MKNVVMKVVSSDDLSHNIRLRRFVLLQQQLSCRRIQAWWRRVQRRKFEAELDDTKKLMQYVTGRSSSPFGLIETGSKLEIAADPTGASNTIEADAVATRPSKSGEFVPLKAVKLSELEALRRQKEMEERRKRQELEELFRKERMRQRRLQRIRTDAACTMQRVCRAYRRRLFLFATMITKTGYRAGAALSANPFLRNINRSRGVVGARLEADLVRMIGLRNPQLIPEYRAALLRKQDATAAGVQRWCRFRYSGMLRRVLLRRRAARIIQRCWRRWQRCSV